MLRCSGGGLGFRKLQATLTVQTQTKGPGELLFGPRRAPQIAVLLTITVSRGMVTPFSRRVFFLLFLPANAGQNADHHEFAARRDSEINGVVACHTPCQLKYPGGYFHKTKTIFGSRLEYPIKARVYKDGFTIRELTLTEVPLEWTAVNGRNHGHLMAGESARRLRHERYAV